MRLVLIADTHEQHDKVQVPDGDVLIHAGDLTYNGRYNAILNAVSWLKAQPHKHVIFVAGNHDFWFEKNTRTAVNALVGDRIHYLEDEAIVIDGVKFWGSPVSPRFYDWAFNVDRGPDIRKYWDRIPEDTDVLITHGPPARILDKSGIDGSSCGCVDLLDVILKNEPRIHVFGHIHGGYGYRQFQHTQFYNASVVNEAYKVVNKPWEVEI